MRYLILFENYESGLWEEISSSDYEDFDLDPISERQKNEIKSLFSDGEIDILFDTAYTFQVRYTFPREIYRKLDYFGVTISNETNLTVDLTDDYYFLVCVEVGFDTRYFKCDEVVGLKKMLIDTGILVIDETT